MDCGRSHTVVALGCIVISDLLGAPLGASDVIAPCMLRGVARARVVLTSFATLRAPLHGSTPARVATARGDRRSDRI